MEQIKAGWQEASGGGQLRASLCWPGLRITGGALKQPGCLNCTADQLKKASVIFQSFPGDSKVHPEMRSTCSAVADGGGERKIPPHTLASPPPPTLPPEKRCQACYTPPPLRSEDKGTWVCTRALMEKAGLVCLGWRWSGVPGAQMPQRGPREGGTEVARPLTAFPFFLINPILPPTLQILHVHKGPAQRAPPIHSTCKYITPTVCQAPISGMESRAQAFA